MVLCGKNILRDREREIYYIKSLEQYNSILTDDDKSPPIREDKWGNVKVKESFKGAS